MTKEDVLGKYGQAYTNKAGLVVPVKLDAHLTFWLRQVPCMEVAQPNTAVMVLYQACCIGEATTTAIPAEIRDNFLLKVLEKRMTANGLIATPWMSAFIAGVSTDPAHVVMWAFFLKVQAVFRNTNLVSMEDIGRTFPKGLPTEVGMDWMWNLQKLGADALQDNMLDHVRMAPSET